MAKVYLEQLQSLISSPLAAKGVRLEIRHFFSGAALYANGTICITLTPAGLALKLPPASRHRIRKEGGRNLRYFPKGPIKKHYIVLPGKIRHNNRRLKAWIDRSIRYSLCQAGKGELKTKG